MKINLTEPIRIFETGRDKDVIIKDCACITLNPDEQVTFLSGDGDEYDVVRKSWGYYATPSTNNRLKNFGLKAVIVRSHESRIYIFLVKKGSEEDFRMYCCKEGHNVILWLDGDTEDFSILDRLTKTRKTGIHSCVCGSGALNLIHEFNLKPPVEVAFKLTQGKKYHRLLMQCSSCRHVISVHKMGDVNIYKDDYVSSNYGYAGLKEEFDRINALPPESSDNIGRIKNIVSNANIWFSKKLGIENFTPTILDIGSGLCVFLHRIKNEYGWNCTALDPDPRNCDHAKNIVGVEVLKGDLLEISPKSKYSVVTLNKVIEHSNYPVKMLEKARNFLDDKGLLYVEVPDAESALMEGPNREEFTIDHPHVFSGASLAICIERAGLKLISMERIKEPSSKYTLRAFATKA